MGGNGRDYKRGRKNYKASGPKMRRWRRASSVYFLTTSLCSRIHSPKRLTVSVRKNFNILFISKVRTVLLVVEFISKVCNRKMLPLIEVQLEEEEFNEQLYRMLRLSTEEWKSIVV